MPFIDLCDITETERMPGLVDALYIQSITLWDIGIFRQAPLFRSTPTPTSKSPRD